MGFRLVPWSLTLVQGQEVKMLFRKYFENDERKRLYFYCRHIENHKWALVWCHDLWPWSKVKRSNAIFKNISKTDTSFHYYCDIPYQIKQGTNCANACNDHDIKLKFCPFGNFAVWGISAFDISLFFTPIRIFNFCNI